MTSGECRCPLGLKVLPAVRRRRMSIGAGSDQTRVPSAGQTNLLFPFPVWWGQSASRSQDPPMSAGMTIGKALLRYATSQWRPGANKEDS